MVVVDIDDVVEDGDRQLAGVRIAVFICYHIKSDSTSQLI